MINGSTLQFFPVAKPKWFLPFFSPNCFYHFANLLMSSADATVELHSKPKQEKNDLILENSTLTLVHRCNFRTHN